ncbi:hypothetical protein BST97_15555 [Nonlabens spongiae]|uniref:Transposase DDE domain-containing protein n=1 Tax=Nonlabens spongiae TaxID=331648 RepID=A0A1W6MJY8_9FLAO|nr:IS982 family transposase [Nonlabens spongiae]ARN76515.1 hypothetical protein BST97_00015 [Nonlabens spongiae]ARN77921.1 hypothetical protein BST97_07870 [Nonlabens spongiae]ARN79286.1 hypothetical protein BST97_15555 [Nonlabens spongiae]
MHDLPAMYKKHLSYLIDLYQTVTVDGNFIKRPVNTKMNDLEVMALAITGEAASIPSENLLFAEIKKHFREDFPMLVDRTRFNRRRRSLEPRFKESAGLLGDRMDDGRSALLVDSMPCPIVHNAREHRMKICMEDLGTAPRKGYSAVDRLYYIGYKLHLLMSTQGIFHDMAVTPANVHDIKFLKERQYDGSEERQIIGDRGYISRELQADLFTSYGIELLTPPRKNQLVKSAFSPERRKNRKFIETRFSQLCSQFSIKINLAKSFKGFLTRVSSKLAAVAMLQMFNRENNRPINRIRHAWNY